MKPTDIKLVQDAISREAERLAELMLHTVRPITVIMESEAGCIEGLLSAKELSDILIKMNLDLRSKLIEFNGVPIKSWATFSKSEYGETFFKLHLEASIPSVVTA